MSVFEINKGVNKPIVFKGFKAQYITFLAIGLVVLLLLFAILYITGVHIYVTLMVILPAGATYVGYIQRLSHKYGEHGLMKQAAFKRLPHSITSKSANLFTALNINHEDRKTGKPVSDPKSRK
ncbi:hypothetical protein HNQ91_000710 [Filimonas zeae]|uniref:DUF4133 domain-containing protein n=1 Tax=Filimonas zeae TaxID=1737353 RepID=A0A917IPZ1_9BACT|nr:DUF4133 domain-containing protein [Filimonas zeae]MDR6337688.1 hypothetical protein [Filimonas zeae]GGH59789.1 hypothetical protein GCM10011379_06960 [Filimonas zeae]